MILSRNLEDFSSASVKFITKNSPRSTLHVGYKAKYIEERMNTTFLGLKIYNHIKWNTKLMK
jgi:hypothetical protein